MTYSWEPVPEGQALHPRLDPVSAWLFRVGSPLLSPRVPDPSLARLVSMPIDAGGFDPGDRVRHPWRAHLVDNPNADVDLADHPFRRDLVDDLLGPVGSEITDPMVHVLGLPADAARSAAELRRFAGFGTPRARRPGTPGRPEAIVGIIDHGINIFHHRFRMPNFGSRVASAWMQGARYDGGPVPFGHEWLQRDIEAAQRVAGTDEDALLRQIGADFARPGFRPLMHRTSHGTHVLDLAAGIDPVDGIGARFPILAVTLPPVVVRETSGSMLVLPLVLGLEYIADRARWIMREANAPAPVFVNVSAGLTGGPRGGRHRIERTIARVAENHRAALEADFGTGDVPPLTVVVAAGNNNLARGSARSRPGEDRLEIGWRLQPADPTSNVMEMRLTFPAGHDEETAQIEIAVTPPDRETPVAETVMVRSEREDDALLLMRSGTAIGRVSGLRHGPRHVILTLAIDGTDPGPERRVVAPAGTWHLALRSLGVPATRIDAWVLRDDVPGGFQDTGRQSYFVDAAHEPLDASGRRVTEDRPDAATTIRHAGSLNAIATGPGLAEDGARETLRVGAHVHDTLRAAAEGLQPVPADYSAAPLDEASEAIDIAAPGDGSRVVLGVLAAGTRSGTRVRVSGTSAAAPQVVRHLALGEGTVSDAEEPERSPRLGARILQGSGPAGD